MNKNLKFAFKKCDIDWVIDNECFYDKGKLVDLYVYKDKIDSSKLASRLNNPNHSRINEESKLIVNRLNYIKKKFYDLFGNDQNIIDNNDLQTDFINWWKKQKRAKDKTLKCYYCGISEKEYFDALKNAKEINSKDYNRYLMYKSSKGKNAWNYPTMEIDEKIPCSKNINDSVFACHICNNAKTDIINADQFKKYIGPHIKKYLKNVAKRKRIL